MNDPEMRLILDERETKKNSKSGMKGKEKK